jgi:hypothetical protein
MAMTFVVPVGQAQTVISLTLTILTLQCVTMRVLLQIATVPVIPRFMALTVILSAPTLTEHAREITHAPTSQTLTVRMPGVQQDMKAQILMVSALPVTPVIMSLLDRGALLPNNAPLVILLIVIRDRTYATQLTAPLLRVMHV